MSDIFGLPRTQNADIQVFQSSGVNAWQTWRKPRSCSFVYIFCGGAGGGGGAGFTGASGTARGGGGGGGSGGLSKVYMPAFLLPDILHVRVGFGGASGSAGTASIIAPAPTTGGDLLIQAAGGATGAVGTATNGGAGGAAGIINTNATTIYSSLGAQVF